jgi:chorismate dehydratase
MPVNVSAVSYLNTIPFLYGLKQSADAANIRLSLAPPARCAEQLESGEVALALTPVAAIPTLPKHHIVTDYCIGANGPVRTVMLLSDTPLEQIHTVYLDPHSRTSSMLVRILAKHCWRLRLAFTPLTQAAFPLQKGEGCVLIGDKVFTYERSFACCYDLAQEWIRWTGRPFVFAAWVSTVTLEPAFLRAFNEALAYGVAHIAEAIENEAPTFDRTLALDYLTHNIHYPLDAPKRDGCSLFLKYLKEV